MISTLRLQNFRSYKDSSFEFDDGINIVVGPNASGKTNLLEAILVLASGKSYRARDGELICYKSKWARLDGFFGEASRIVKITTPSSSPTSIGDPENKKQKKLDSRFRGNDAIGSPSKLFELDDKPFKRLSLERTIPVVLFEPNHLQLVSRGPDQRRQFFDDILERTEPGFKTLDGQYRRTLAQRNSLLKQGPTRAGEQLFAWNIRLSELGGKIATHRQILCDDINKTISRTYGHIAGKRTKVNLVYEASVDPAHYSTKLLKKLENTIDIDLARGFTTYGPHREDITISLNGQPAASSASRGEIRSLILALKIYELKLVEKTRGSRPIFLLDDVFSELDGSRRQHLVEYLKDYQTIITTTDADAVMEYFTEESKITPVRN